MATEMVGLLLGVALGLFIVMTTRDSESKQRAKREEARALELHTAQMRLIAEQLAYVERLDDEGNEREVVFEPDDSDEDDEPEREAPN